MSIKKIICNICFITALTVSCYGLVFSQEKYSLEQIHKRLEAIEQKNNNNKGIFDNLAISAAITLILQNAQNANGDITALYNGKTPTMASYSIDLGFEKTFDDLNKMFIHLETWQGSIEEQLKLFSNVNRDADDSDAAISVTEAWYEHKFSNTGLSITAGKIDATAGVDENAYANDETTQFLGHLFRNNAAIDLPEDNSFGTKLFMETSNVDFTLQYAGAKEKFEDITRDFFVSAQINLKPEFISSREGNYRFYTWLNSREYTQWKDPSKNDEKNYGFGISFDQQIINALGAFARYGLEKPEVFYIDNELSLSQSWSFGLRLNLPLIAKEDILAVAYGQLMPSNEYKDFYDYNADTEKHMEIYYNCKVNDFLSVTPDFQIIENPYGNDLSSNDKDTVYICGIRAQISF